MKNKMFSLISMSLFVAIICALFATPFDVYAAGTVGDGSPESCTEAALDVALTGGGVVDFDCGPAPHTIVITGTKTISNNTQIDGGGLVTISGDNLIQLFTVDSSINFEITGLTLADGYISGGNGGAILINSGATVTISTSTLDHNNTLNGYGGAIYVDAGTLNISDSTFSNNSADVDAIGSLALGGGAIQNNDGTVTITGSTFTDNSVISYTADGGAIYNGDFDGGPGVPDANPDTLTITNSTFYNNLVRSPADVEADSGGAIRSASVLTLTHNTFSNNDSGDNSGSGDKSGAVTITHGTATLTNNIFANSTGPDCAKRDTVSSITSTGNLIESNVGCGTPITASDPGTPFILGNNGGPTQTIALSSGSPAIDNTSITCAAATDQRGVTRSQNTYCDIGAYEFDQTLPDTTITSNPPNPDNNGDPAFTFTGDDGSGGSGVASFECQMDSGGFSTCTSGSSFGPLTDGSHTFEVHAVDYDGNADASPASYNWVVDTTAPTVSITGNPADPTNDTSASFTFTTGGSPVAVDCKLDAGSYAACDSGTTQSYAGPLAERSHTFTVRVTDAATNSSTDSYTWVVDTTAPTVSITGNPADPTNDTSASFTFTTGGSPVAVDCKLDAGSYAACDSGTTQSYAGPLAEGIAYLHSAGDRCSY